MKDILEYAIAVVKRGKISKTSKGKQYCFVTVFNDKIAVCADKNKMSDRLVIEKVMKK